MKSKFGWFLPSIKRMTHYKLFSTFLRYGAFASKDGFEPASMACFSVKTDIPNSAPERGASSIPSQSSILVFGCCKLKRSAKNAFKALLESLLQLIAAVSQYVLAINEIAVINLFSSMAYFGRKRAFFI